MKFTPPKTLTFLIALALAVIGLILHYRMLVVPVLAGRAFWFEVAAFGLLALAVMFRGL